MRSRILRIVGLVLLAALGALLYADILSIHQIHPITQAAIDKAPNPETRQFLIAEKESRDQRERRNKMEVAAVLGIDVTLFLWLAVGIVRRPTHPRASAAKTIDGRP